ncbi:regulatory cyclin phoB [Aspergillus thermomutatus]|uniref:Cyclin-dependent protein kinase regulator Pho80 n=1 Tax=Aspergillus thermomutatus TaxID=41047 RepID=A0A397GKT2_ASPTH|nr:uncharacterized protein CDV56_104933 [Aspergillus thermomutatus]RHZ50348.1 hypothetical protein CDV56_104933 [Aspergillus thermomutatus]
MLASSPSPSAAFHPSSSSPPTHSHPSLSSPSFSHRSTTAAVAAATAAHNLRHHYEPARHPPASSSHFSPRSSRLAIEELRSALTRHTVDASPPGPSGDLPRGRMSAGLTTLGGGNSTYSSGTPAFAVDALANPPLSSGRPTDTEPVGAPPVAASAPAPAPATAPSVAPPMPASNKRNSPNDHGVDASLAERSGDLDLDRSQSKRLRPSKPDVKYLPENYDQADPRDLVILISSMLMELIRFNDKIPLHNGRLTRFHSRSPPRISVQDYLQRLTTHATLSPPILLSMVYYIDRLCALYPAFTVSSLTIHRFLITSATVASKGLSDSFWTNKTYARVGGISMAELALLELEFLFRVEWRIVPQPEVLVDYYQSLVERCDGYEIKRDG